MIGRVKIGLLRDKTTIVVLFQNAGNVFAYLFQIGLAKVLTTEDFGSFNALFAISLVLAAPAISVQLLVAKAIVELPEAKQCDRLQRLFGVAFLSALLLTFIVALGLYLVRGQIAVTSAVQLSMTGAIVGSQFLASVLSGAIQGLRLYTAFGFATGLIPLMRFVFLLLAVFASQLGSTVALGLCVASNLVAVIYCARRLPRSGVVKEAWCETWHWIVRALFVGAGSAGMFLGSAFVMFFSNIDIVLVRVYCTETESGQYAASAVIGRIIFLVPMALAQVLFSESVHERTRGKSPLPRLIRSLAMTMLIAGPITLACWIAPELLVRLVVGARYVLAAAYLPWIALAMLSLSLANVILMFLIPTQSAGYIWIFATLAVGLVLSVSAQHGDPAVIAGQLAVATTALVVGLLVYVVLLKPQPQPR